MSKKMMVLGLAVVSAALFALPAVASAQSWHIDQTTSFSVTGSGGSLTSTSGTEITCTSTTGSGSFSTTTGGAVSLIFHGCVGPFLAPCTTPGQSSGTITATNTFDGIMVNSTASTKDPGVLLTPTQSAEPTPGLKQFTEFTCFGINIKVFGSGTIGTLSSSVCSTPSETATITFTSSSAGHQADKTWTGATYDLSSTITASHPTSSLDGTATMSFGGKRVAACT